MRRIEAYNLSGENIDALKASGSFFPDYNNGHRDITSTNGTQEPTDFIGDHRIGTPLKLKRTDGSQLPIIIVDIKGQLTDAYWETEEEMIGGTYKRPERPYTPKKVKLSLGDTPSCTTESVITGRYTLQDVRAELAKIRLESTIPLVVGAHPNGNGHINGHEVAKPVSVQKA